MYGTVKILLKGSLNTCLMWLVLTVQITYKEMHTSIEVGHLTNPDTAAYAPKVCGKHAEVSVQLRAQAELCPDGGMPPTVTI